MYNPKKSVKEKADYPSKKTITTRFINGMGIKIIVLREKRHAGGLLWPLVSCKDPMCIVTTRCRRYYNKIIKLLKYISSKTV
jgi:hypothetical protein